MKWRLFILLWLLVLAGTYIIPPRPQDLRIANLGSYSFAVGWVSHQPSQACLYVIEGKWGLGRRWSVCGDRPDTAHLVWVDMLNENEVYRLVAYNGWRIYPQTYRQVQTYISAPEPMAPRPAYGTVIDLKDNLIPNALVYIYPRVEAQVYPVAARANEVGNFAVDVGTFGQEQDDWIVEGGSGLRQWDWMQVKGVLTPLPPLEVSVP